MQRHSSPSSHPKQPGTSSRVVGYGLGVRFLHLGWSRTSSNGGSSRSCRASADPPSPLGLAPRHVLEPSCGNITNR
jgi:hypothetical protein